MIQADLNKGLGAFGSEQFDCVVLSQTLQAVQDVEGVLTEMVRIGRTCIVSIPNFGYHRLRKMLAETGRAPKSAGVLHYEWYNTPNIRFFTIADFEDFCREKKHPGASPHRARYRGRGGSVRASQPERRPGDFCDQPLLALRASDSSLCPSLRPFVPVPKSRP